MSRHGRVRSTTDGTAFTILLTIATTATAGGPTDDGDFIVPSPQRLPWEISFGSGTGGAGAAPAARLRLSTDVMAGGSAEAPRQSLSGPPALADDQTASTPAFVYSEGYNTRRRIHFIASFATLPLFVTQVTLGSKLYAGTGSSGTRTVHRGVAMSIGALFGANTVTGVWNLVEGRKDPNGRAKRFAHGLLMLAADAGFAATAMLAPGTDGSGNRQTHRAVALTSLGAATTGYLIMLFGR
jgi:hypothetical protein